ncbi:class C sortase [Bifidobacterium commune]|nr:class C sortase [Bifidobacterium commune]
MNDDFSTVVALSDNRRGCSSKPASRHRKMKSDAWMKTTSIIILILGLVTVTYPFVRQYISGLEQSRLTEASSHAVSNWPYPQAEVALKNAELYNKALAASDQPVMGEAVDPFKEKGSVTQTESEADARYQHLLDQGDGIMGSILIPKISVNLPIYHGTSQAALASGSGHLYGSSLPVGGESTHAVITGHRGMVDSLMFTRLDEMKIGDSFYIKSMNRTIAYRVDRIRIIEPDDTSSLRIERGVDRVTLMTCTPYGINSHRLLVSATRAEMPIPVPYPNEAKKDFKVVVFIVSCFAGVSLLATFFVLDNKKALIARHAQEFKKI